MEEKEESSFYTCNLCDGEIGDYRDMLNNAIEYVTEYEDKIHICEECCKTILKLSKEKDFT